MMVANISQGHFGQCAMNGAAFTEDRTATTVYVVLLICLAVVIFCLNGIALFATIKYIRANTSPPFILIINLIAADLFMGLVLPVQVLTRLEVLTISTAYMCFLRLSTMTMGTFVSLFSILLTAVDRYWAVCRLTTYQTLTGKLRIVVAIVVMWTYSFVVAVYPVHFFTVDTSLQLVSNECVFTDSVSKAYSLFISIQYFSVVLLMCLLYSRVGKTALRRRRIISCDTVLCVRVWRLQRELRIVKLTVMLLVVFALCWTSYAIFEIYMALASELNLLLLRFGNASVFLGILQSVVNPIIYPCQNREFKRAFQRMFNTEL